MQTLIKNFFIKFDIATNRWTSSELLKKVFFVPRNCGKLYLKLSKDH